jgi:MFS family permease
MASGARVVDDSYQDSYRGILLRQPNLAFALSGNLLMRLTSAATGLMLTLYLAFINREHYHVSAAAVGIIAAGFYITEMITAPLIGAQSDRRGRRLLLVGGPLTALVAVLLTAITTSFPLLFLTRVLEGAAAAGTVPPMLGYLSARSEARPGLRARVMTLFELSTAVGMISGAVIASLLWQALGRGGFVALALMYLVNAVLFWLIRDADVYGHEPGVKHPSLLESFRRVLVYPALLRFAPAWLAVNTIAGLWITHAIFQLQPGHHRPGQELMGAFHDHRLALVLGVFGLLFFLGSLVWGNAIPNLGEIRAMRITLFGVLGATAALLIMNHSGGVHAVMWLGAALFFAMVVLESGFAPAAVSYLASLSSLLRQDRGLTMGIYSIVLGLGQFIGGGPLGGVFADAWGLDGVILLSFLLGGAALVSTRMLVQPKAPSLES